MLIEINNQTNYSVSEEKVVSLLRLASRVLAIGKRQRISIAFVSPSRIKELNYVYRSKKKVTDVLSFALSPAEAEIIICPKVAKDQAKKGRDKFEREILTLTLHGFLHANGFDHERSKTGARKMARMEEMIMKKFYD